MAEYEPTPGEYDHRGIDCAVHGANSPHRRKKGETGSFDCINCILELVQKLSVAQLPESGSVAVDAVLASQGLGPGGKKNDAGKDRWDLLPLVLLRGVTKVLTFGAKTYDDNSWQKVPNGLVRYRAAQERHFSKVVLDAEESDSDSGLHHAYHYATNALFVAWLMIFRPEQVKTYRESQQ